MSPFCLVALPRLHPDLLLADNPDHALPPGVATLWPGLPDSIRVTEGRADWFRPEFPWSPREAAACLADFERLAHDGAGGSPVTAACAEARLAEPADLSPAERRALADWKLTAAQTLGAPNRETTPSAWTAGAGGQQDVTREEQEYRQAAQRTLLLCWLREAQYLEMARLKAKVSLGQNRLSAWLNEGVTDSCPEAERVAEADPGVPLPPWRVVWEAARVFLPPELVVVVTDAGMAEAVRAQGREPAALPEGMDVPAGWVAVRTSALSDPRWGTPEERVYLCPVGQPGQNAVEKME